MVVVKLLNHLVLLDHVGGAIKVNKQTCLHVELISNENILILELQYDVPYDEVSKLKLSPILG